MSVPPIASLADLAPYLKAGRLDGCPCGRPHTFGTRDVMLAPGALDGIAEILSVGSAARGRVLLLADPDTYDAAGARTASGLREAGFLVHEKVYRTAPRADDLTLESTRPALRDSPVRIVAVGSGTISDLGKVLAGEAGVPLLTVGTAASMNGYASPIAALTVGGLKVTRPAPPPDLLVLDNDVLCAAPPRLTRAGFGDLASKPASSADWLLSHLLLGEAVCPTALSLADRALGRARAGADALGRLEPGAVATLAEALVVSSLSMSVAGASSPVSGGEHLLSHYLDISAEARGREPRLHGEQVAVGTLASLSLYRRLREVVLDANGEASPPEETSSELEALHAHLRGPALEALLAEARAKAARVPRRAERRRTLARRWSEIWQGLDAPLSGSESVARDLERAGAPCTFQAIGVSERDAAGLLRRARHMRDRYTVLDLAADLDVLERFAGEIASELGG